MEEWKIKNKKNKKICGEVVCAAAGPIGGGRGYVGGSGCIWRPSWPKMATACPAKRAATSVCPFLSDAKDGHRSDGCGGKGRMAQRQAGRMAQQQTGDAKAQRQAAAVRRAGWREEAKRSNATGSKEEGRKGPKTRASWL